VGVFPTTAGPRRERARLPHAGGGVSPPCAVSGPRRLSSPRGWGCFSGHQSRRASRSVFPTRVGVFLHRQMAPRPRARLPHAGGGVSTSRLVPSNTASSSPRGWGCFLMEIERNTSCKVFPTRVGVFPLSPSGFA